MPKMRPAVVYMAMMGSEEILLKCLKRLYQEQVSDEQEIKQSKHKNKRGFNTPDAPILSKYIDALNEGQILRPASIADIQDRMQKYAKQLSEYPDIEQLLS